MFCMTPQSTGLESRNTTMNQLQPGLTPEVRLARAILESSLEDIPKSLPFFVSWQCRVWCHFANLPYHDLITHLWSHYDHSHSFIANPLKEVQS